MWYVQPFRIRTTKWNASLHFGRTTIHWAKPKMHHKFYDKWLTMGFHQAEENDGKILRTELNRRAANMKCSMLAAARFGDKKKKTRTFSVCFFTDYYYIYDYYLCSASVPFEWCVHSARICHAKEKTTNHWQIENPIRCNLTLAHQTGPEISLCE